MGPRWKECRTNDNKLIRCLDIMDYFKFMNEEEIPDRFREKIDGLVTKEFANIKKEHVHPEVRDILAKSRDSAKSIEGFSEELKNLQRCGNDKKRTSGYDDYDDDDTLFLQEYKSKYPRIDTSRYVPHASADTSLLGIASSYLKHQEIILRTLLPQTISNQWMINNDQIQQTSRIVEDMSSQQRKQISDLETYREGLQRRYEPMFSKVTGRNEENH